MARVVVVGGGLAGTASAARLAKLGHRVTLLERRDRLGGAIGFVERSGYRWDAGATHTTLPAVLRDLFRKSGRPLERVLELVPVDPAREHRWPDGSTLPMPAGSRAAQMQSVEDHLGAGAGRAWGDYTRGFADTWDLVRREYLEQPYSPAHLSPRAREVLHGRTSLARLAHRALTDRRLREVALLPARLAGHDPRRVPAWVGMTAYLEQTFGVWAVAGGLGALADALTTRLAERRVEVRLGTTAHDVALRDGRAVGVATAAGTVPADVVVCAVDPRRLPALAAYVRRTTPAPPPATVHLGLRGEVPDLPHEAVLHGDPLLVVRTSGTATEGRHAWTVHARGRHREDVLDVAARRGLDVRRLVEVRVDRSPQDLVAEWGGSPYGVLWRGRRTLRRRIGTTTPVPGVLCAGAHATPGAGVPFVGLGAALVAQVVGRA